MKILKHFFAFIEHIKLDFVRVAQILFFCVDNHLCWRYCCRISHFWEMEIEKERMTCANKASAWQDINQQPLETLYCCATTTAWVWFGETLSITLFEVRQSGRWVITSYGAYISIQRIQYKTFSVPVDQLNISVPMNEMSSLQAIMN